MKTGLILLAAGASSRLGRPKQLLQYQGQTLLRRAAETALASGCQPIVIVTGAQHAALLPELAGLPVQVAHCADWAAGMGASLKTGLAALEDQPEGTALSAVIVQLCDQPLVTPELLQQLVAQHAATKQSIVASAYAGTVGVPVLFGVEAWPLLHGLADAAGAGQLLKHHLELLATVPFADGAVDVDTEQQYAALLAR